MNADNTKNGPGAQRELPAEMHPDFTKDITEAPLERPIEPDLPIVDPHHHLWVKPPFPGLTPYPVEKLAADRAAGGHKVKATVFVDCETGYLTEGPSEMRYLGEVLTVEGWAKEAEAAGGDKTGIAAGIVSRANMTLGDDVEPLLLKQIEASPTRFRGVRFMTPWHPGHDFYGLGITEKLMRTDAFGKGVACLARLGLTFEAWLLFTQLSDVAYLARKVPQATIILNHTGTPIPLPGFDADEAYDIWRKGMAEVASCPNVVAKIGGLSLFGKAAGKMDSASAADMMRRYVLPTIDFFTPDRCMFESNFPVDGGKISYGNLWNAFKRLTKDFTRSEREKMFANNALRTYRLKMPDGVAGDGP